MHGVRNGLKTAVLFGVLGALLVGGGGLIAGRTGLIIGLLIAVAVNAFSYFNSDKIALRSMRARPVTQVEQPAMYRIVRELATSARQPMPRLYVSPTAAPNAFATGRSPRHAAVCATDGILQILTERELRAVLSHELSHVYNRDILISSVAGCLAAGITMLAQFGMFFGGGGDDRDRNVFAELLMIFLGTAGGVADPAVDQPLARVPGRRVGGAAVGRPARAGLGAAQARGGTAARPLLATPTLTTTSHLMIANPFGGARSWFSTHPPMQERIARLERMAKSDPRYLH